MPLMKTISGFRGTLGHPDGNNLTPLNTVGFAAAYGKWLKESSGKDRPKMVVGRDARISGPMIQGIVVNTLIGMGVDVVDLGLSTTPTVEVAVPLEDAQGGIILTASHNPKEWNALKMLDHNGEFLNGVEAAKIIEWADAGTFDWVGVDDLGEVTQIDDYIERHVNMVLELPYVNLEAIRGANFKVVVDGVNSTGGIAVPMLLRRLGVEVIELYCEPTGHFPHNPEPLAAHLTDLSDAVIKEGAHLGITVDPDVDRLAFMSEDGKMFGEEYTLVAVADYLLARTPGVAVSNLSSSRALQDVAEKHGGRRIASMVGEVNVVQAMKDNNAVIGGEGNGGIIYPGLHYGRDALIGIVYFMSLLAEHGGTTSELRATYPDYHMSKQKIQLTPSLNPDEVLSTMAEAYAGENVTDIDGVKIDFDKSWVHMRKSNTEPIIRVYTEAPTQQEADALAHRFMSEIAEKVGV